MANTYNFSRGALLKRVGLSPGKKLQIFFITAILLTIPVGYVYNSIAVILFVLHSLLAAKKENFSFCLPVVLPMLLFVLMAVSLAWSIDPSGSLKALGKEAALLFVPIAFMLNKRLSRRHINQIFNFYTIGMCVYGLYFLGRAALRYFATGDTGVFFYHELSTLNFNAIYFSALLSVAVFYLIGKKHKNFWTILTLAFLSGLIFLLSSKTVILINVVLVIVYYMFFSGISKKLKVMAIAVFCIMAFTGIYFGKVGERLTAEFGAEDPARLPEPASGIHTVSSSEAWYGKHFEQNYHFNGTAFRIYQIRILVEMLQEDPVFFTGYGLNASCHKVEEKGVEYNVFTGDESNYGYNKLNFHNQYAEVFADLGIFGFLLLIFLQVYNLKNALQSKDFVHIAFAVLMISLFLTESFLQRQRGVVFFTVLYCLYNTVYRHATQKNKYEENSNNRSSRIFGVTSV